MRSYEGIVVSMCADAIQAMYHSRPIPFPVRFLCIDLGDKRTGLALGDDLLRIASPIDVLEIPAAADAGNALPVALVAAARDHAADALVVGLPINMDGSEGPRAKSVRALAQRIARDANLPLHFQDERLSSADADWQMARSGLTRGQKKARRDALAAAAILRDFLAALPTPPSPFSPPAPQHPPDPDPRLRPGPGGE